MKNLKMTSKFLGAWSWLPLTLAIAGCGSATSSISDLLEEVSPVEWSAKISTSSDAINIMEGNGVNVVFVLSEESKSSANFDWEIVDNETRFVAASGSGKLTDGKKSFSFLAQTINDSLYQGNTASTLKVRGPKFTNEVTIQLNVIDDETNIGLSLAPISVSESAGSTALTFTLSNVAKEDVTFNYATSSGTATSGVDFVALSGTATIPAGQTTVTKTLSILSDGLFEGDETLSVAITNASSAATIITPSTTVTIVDDDSPPTLAINNISVGENAGPAVFTVSLSQASGKDVLVNYAASGVSAIVGVDFNVSLGTLTIPAGQTSGTISIPLVDDLTYEGNETFTVDLSSPTNATLLTSQGVGTIVDNDSVPTIAIADNSALEDSGTLVFTVTKTGATIFPLTVNYATATGSASSADFTATSGTLTIAAGATTGTISVPLTADSVYEGHETFTMTLSSPSGATISTATATGTITNDDTAPTVAIAANSVNEDSGPLVFTVTKTGSTAYALTVDYTTSSGTATAGSDFTTTSGTLTIAAGATTGIISVPVTADAVYENDETFTVTLSNPTAATISTAAATGTITNDDTAPTIAIANNFVNEDSGPLVFTVTKTGSSALPLTVDYTTSSGTATAGSDFTTTSGTLTIAAGATTGTISVPITADSVYENNETFSLTLSNPSGATITTAAATGTITNDDSAPTLAISDSSVAEDSGPLVFTVTKTGSTALALTVDYATSNGTASSASDYTSTTGTLTIAAGATSGTISVPTTIDATIENDETLTMTLSNASGATITTAAATGTITNDDSPTISGVSPSQGSDVGGTTITLTGTGFLSGATATVAGATCTSPTVVSSTSFTCVTPAGTAGAVDVVITNSVGSQPSGTRSGTSTGGYTYRADNWNFGVSGDFTFDSTLFTTSQALNKATLTPLDLTQNTQAEFDSGIHVGTVYSGSSLKLDSTTSAVTEMTSAWAPKWSNLVGYWKLENDFQDSRTGNHLTGSGGATFSASSRVGSYAGSFDGVDDYASVPDPADGSLDFGTTSFSYAVWVNVTSSAGTLDVPISKGGSGGSPGYKMELGTGSWDARIRDIGGTEITCNFGTEASFLGRWVYLSVSIDRTNTLMRCFVNGQQISTGTLTSSGVSNSTVFRIGRYSTSEYFKGLIDDAAIWNTNLDASDFQLIYDRQKQKYSGIYTSPVGSVPTATSFSSARWVSSLPFYKELPGETTGDTTADPESSSDYSAISSSSEDLSNGLFGLWHFDQSSWNGTSGEAVDSSGKSHNLTAQGGATTSTEGPFKNSGSFDGVSNFLSSSSFDLGNLSNFSVSVWMKNDNAIPASDLEGIFLKKVQVMGISMKSTGKINVCITNDNGWHCTSSPSAYSDWNQWHHFVATYDSSYLRMYRDGKKILESAEAGVLPATNNAIWIGKSSSNIFFKGKIDEIGSWTHTLSDSEVLQLYRRGANRNKFQFRTCTQNNCSDSPSYVGPDGTASTWYSELHNMVSVISSGAGSGLVNLASPVLDFTKWIAAVSGWAFNPAPAKYFQYRALMESDDLNNLCSTAPCMPDITSVTSIPAVPITTAVGRAFPTALTQFSITQSGDCGTQNDVRFQVSSDDGTTYKYWNGSAWTAVSSANAYSQAASYSLTSTNISTLASSGTFRFKALVPSQYGKTCYLQTPYIRW